MPVSTVVAVTHLAPLTAKTTRVTYRVERVLTVNLAGPESVVTEVRREYASLVGSFYVKYYFNFI